MKFKIGEKVFYRNQAVFYLGYCGEYRRRILICGFSFGWDGYIPVEYRNRANSLGLPNLGFFWVDKSDLHPLKEQV